MRESDRGKTFPDVLASGTNGLTKREYFAAMALIGMAATPSSVEAQSDTHRAIRAVALADELITALNGKTK